jgi:outer membrane murein-binding lipoprotein Lpp
MSLPTIGRRRHALHKPTADERIDALTAQVTVLRREVEAASAAANGWKQRALSAERTLHNLPSEVATPARTIWRLQAKIRHLAADRAHWRSRAQVAERALGNRIAIALSADGAREGRAPIDPDGEDTQTMTRPGPLLPPPGVLRHGSSAWATQRQIATLQQALGGAA